MIEVVRRQRERDERRGVARLGVLRQCAPEDLVLPLQRVHHPACLLPALVSLPSGIASEGRRRG